MTAPVEFLGGQVQVRQARGYRAGLDAVLLAAAVGAKPEQSVLELGCGAGTALICAAHLHPRAQFYGLEKNPDAARLAVQNIAQNAMQDRVSLHQGDVFAPPPSLRPDSFDEVFFNPPFYDDARAIRGPAAGKVAAFIQDGPGLADWISSALRLTRGRGHVCLIQRAERLDDCLAALSGRAGDIHILPVAPHFGEAAHRIVIRARKNVKTPLRLLAPLVIHEKGRTWTPQAEAVLKGELALDI